MRDYEFSKQLMLTEFDKCLSALIVLLAGFCLHRALEGIKSRLSREQDFVKTANVVVVDLSKKPASGNHLVCWMSWSESPPVLWRLQLLREMVWAPPSRIVKHRPSA